MAETVRKTYKEKLRPTPEQERRWTSSCGAAARSTTSPWSSARPPGSGATSR